MKWLDFLELAVHLHGELRKKPALDDAVGRTIASRAYYSAFLRSQSLVGRAPKGAGSSHSWVTDQLAHSKNDRKSQLGTTLARLKSLRVQADYQCDTTLTSLEVAGAIEFSRSCHKILDDLGATESP